MRDAAGASHNYTSGVASGALLRYVGLDSFAWWVDPDLSAPVRVHLSESLTGVFADAQIEVTHLPVDAATVEVGDLRSIDTDIVPDVPWYTWRVASRTDQAGLVSLTGETLLGRLARTRPRESFIIIAGEGGVPNPLDLRECLRRFLTYYGVPFDPDLPAFVLRAGDDNVVPTVAAFAIQPNQEEPESILDWLDRFFAPFRGYAFRADGDDRLIVTPPAWVDTVGLRLTIYTRLIAGGFPVRRASAFAPWSSSRQPTVELVGTVDGTAYQHQLSDPLEPDTPVDVPLGALTVRIEWDATEGRVLAYQWPTPVLMQTAPLYTVTVVLRPDGTDGQALELLEVDLRPEATTTIDAERVYNQAIVRVQDLDWQGSQQVMQAGALVLRSPGGVMPGLFTGNAPFGPMAEELETPGGFHELVNDTVQSGTWFWPADDNVIMQPGGQITVAFEVEEWAEQWRDTSAPHAPAVNVNNWSDTAALPANGTEVKLFDFQFPRQTSNAAPSPYGARGTVWGRWRAGENPGIEVRVGNSHFVEFGFLWEGIGGRTVYFLWGAVVKLNGTGTTFTTGDTQVHRFGYAQSEDGAWERGANVPALSESQAAYPSRVLDVTLPYPLTEAQAIAVARGIVEENLHPRAVHHLVLVAHPDKGWPLTPADLGRVVNVPSQGMQGRLLSLSYDEAHVPGGSQTVVTAELEEIASIPGSSTAIRSYRAAHFGRSTYQQED